MKAKIKITKDTTINEVLNANPAYITILQGFGMHCLGCPMSRMETLEQAAEAHGFDLEMLLDKLKSVK